MMRYNPVAALGALIALTAVHAQYHSDSSAAQCPASSWPARAAAVHQACCPHGGNHRRQLQDDRTPATDCDLPSSCPSAACAAEFLPFVDQCRAFVQAESREDNGRESVEYTRLYSSCAAQFSQYVGRSHVLNSGTAVATVGDNTDPLTCSFHIVCERPGQNCAAQCRGSDVPSPGRNCDALLSASQVQEVQQLIRTSAVLLLSTRRDQGGNRANSRFYDENVCVSVHVLDSHTEGYLACLHPDENVLGQPTHSYVYTGGQYMGSGFVVVGQSQDDFDARMAHSGVALECGAALEPPPPPAGEVEACYKPGSTAVVAQDASVPAQCATHKAVLPATCDAHSDVAAWNAYVGCVFQSNGWAKYRSGGNGGCSGPTTFALCEAAFPGDPERIKCCSNSRCAWSASLFGANSGHPACITPEWAVNICCMPCTCWLSPPNAQDIGGNANMTIVESGYGGRDYPVLVNADGFPIAVPFRCGRTGLFGSGNVIQVSQWQHSMGNCGHDPMGGGEFDEEHLHAAKHGVP